MSQHISDNGFKPRVSENIFMFNLAPADNEYSRQNLMEMEGEICIIYNERWESANKCKCPSSNKMKDSGQRRHLFGPLDVV